MKSIVYLAMVFLTMPTLYAQTDLDLNTALDLARNSQTLQQLLGNARQLADADVQQTAVWKHPTLQLTRQDDNQGAEQVRETELSIAQAIPLPGARAAKMAASQAHADVVVWENRGRELAYLTLVKQTFFDLLHRQETERVLARHILRLDETMGVIVKREAAGEVSGFDRLRFQRALDDAVLARSRNQTQHRGAADRLAGLLGLDAPPTVTGTLVPPQPKSLNLAAGPKLKLMAQQARAFNLEERAARYRLTQVTVSAGVRNVDVNGRTDTGLVLGASVPLPIGKSNRVRQARARAAASLAESKRRQSVVELQSQEAALTARITGLQEAGLAYRNTAVTRSQELVTIAQAAYQAGEIDILALVDAWQSLRASEIQALALEAEARDLFIQWQELGGAL